MPGTNEFTPWSTLRGLWGSPPAWVPEEDIQRIQAYEKYEEIYWNDPRQFALRVLEGEEPLYIPNARTIVDTTSHYLLKGLSVTAPDKNNAKLASALKAFLDRELVLSRFHIAKHAGVAQGDFAFHMVANPKKAGGTRISVTAVDVAQVFPLYEDDDAPERMTKCHLVNMFRDDQTGETLIKKLTYEVEVTPLLETRKVFRSEGIYKLAPKWWGSEPELVKTTLNRAALDERITTIPVYWFKNIPWSNWEFGSSELKGFESLVRSVSQGSTDINTALALEGLGVYATDGGRPVNDDGSESDWYVSPGRVMEVPSGAYFRRVEGISSVTPATDQINYIESKIREAGGLSDVALGRVDVQTAQSGIALAIKFLPTLAKIEERDEAGLGKLKQFWHDWQIWHWVFEHERIDGDIETAIGEKLPEDRTAKVNELNNMIDRGIIPGEYYRSEMEKLGYVFPENIQEMLDKESEKKAAAAAAAAPPSLQPNAVAAATGAKPPPAQGGVDQGSQTPRGQDASGRKKTNRARNGSRVNESKGTEA